MNKNLVVVAVGALVTGLIAMPALALASSGVGINTRPYIPSKAIYYDANHDGQNQPSELIGTYDVYDPLLPFTFYWSALPGATYYRVSLIQFAPPNKGADGPGREIQVSHHSASDPNGMQFTMAVYDGSPCLDCVTVIQVISETRDIVPDGQGGTMFQYSALPGKLVSAPFVFELPPRPTGSGKRGPLPVCGDSICTPPESVVAGPWWCPDDCPDGTP